MVFNVRRPQYFISHSKSQRLHVTRHRLSFTLHTRKVSLGDLCLDKLEFFDFVKFTGNIGLPVILVF